MHTHLMLLPYEVAPLLGSLSLHPGSLPRAAKRNEGSLALSLPLRSPSPACTATNLLMACEPGTLQSG